MDIKASFIGFLRSVASTVSDIGRPQQQTMQLAATTNPMAGLVVKDLWVAHTAKRAWAVRGAGFACRNGEVVIVLGDDGSGKTRLLTSLVESMVAPPRRALSSTRVRGAITLGGLDVSKWDRPQLKKRLGVVLNDVRTVADMARVFGGVALEEILEPVDGLKSADPSHQPGAREKAAVHLGLKITGLYDSLLPRLPTKLSTIVTANEEDLRPSPLRPRYHVLSPSEWAKLLLTQAVAQAIFDNDNSVGSNDRIENSLVGSLLLLDDASVLLSETEEASLLRELRSTGAATILTSNKWATGRLVDRILVMKDGVLVESGTHNELLARGPQHSLYASKWYQMTSQ